MGALLAYLGRHRESAYYYEQAVALGPEDYLMISNLADAYRRTSRVAEAGRTYGQALDAAERQLARNQRDAFARAFVAYAQARLGRDSAADAEIRRALREAPQDGKILRRAVLLYQALGRSEEAMRLLERAPAAVLDELSIPATGASNSLTVPFKPAQPSSRCRPPSINRGEANWRARATSPSGAPSWWAARRSTGFRRRHSRQEITRQAGVPGHAPRREAPFVARA